MYFLGIDPSTTRTGIAIVDENKKVFYVNDMKGRADDPAFFYCLFEELDNLFNRFDISAIAIEDQFFGVNPDTLKKVSRISGVGIVLAGQENVPCYMQIPSAWRKYWMEETGIHAWDPKDSYKKKAAYSKEEIFYILQMYFPEELHNFKKDNDKADALGIAWACSQIFIHGLPEVKKKKRKTKRKVQRTKKA